MATYCVNMERCELAPRRRSGSWRSVGWRCKRLTRCLFIKLTWLPSSKRTRIGVFARIADAILRGVCGNNVDDGVLVVVVVMVEAPV